MRAAHRRAPVVLVAIHAGAEGVSAQHVTGREEVFLGEDRGNPRRFARAMIAAGATAVVGSGPHVVRGIEIYRHHPIVYSTGNFAGWRTFSLGRAARDLGDRRAPRRRARALPRRPRAADAARRRRQRGARSGARGDPADAAPLARGLRPLGPAPDGCFGPDG